MPFFYFNGRETISRTICLQGEVKKAFTGEVMN